MSRWEFTLAHRGRDQLLIDAAVDCGRHLTGEAAVTARKLVMSSAACGMNTIGELLDALEALEPSQRRSLLDAARFGAGLKSIEDVEARERAEFAGRAGRLRVAATHGKPLRLAFREGGGFVDLDEAEADAAAERARAASLEAQRAAQRADREADATALAARQQGRDDQLQRELPQHLRAVPT